MAGSVVAHVVRRGVEIIQDQAARKAAYISHLQHDAELYEQSDNPLQPAELLPVAITVVLTLLLLVSIDYTVGQVISSLAIIESPSSTAIVETSPPPYSDEDAKPLEKEPLVAFSPEAQVEIAVIDHKLITSKIRSTIGHLHRTGGFFSRWRGLGLALFYHALHSTFTNFLTQSLGLGMVGEMFMYTFVSLGLCRVHMAWTHKMISEPTSEWWFKRLPARKNTRLLVLPAFIYAFAEQATLFIPIQVALALDVAGSPEGPPRWVVRSVGGSHDCTGAIMMFLRLMAVPLSYAALSLLLLFPASVTLTRVEAALLPENVQTIVPFNRLEILGDADISTLRGRRAVHRQAWRSFDGASRWRLIKLYAKMYLAQIAVAFIALHVVLVELYAMGPERIVTAVKSGFAQIQLVAIEAHDKAQ